MLSRFSFKASAIAILAAALTAASTSGQAGGPTVLHVHVTGNGKVTGPAVLIDCGMGAKKCTTSSTINKAPLHAEPAQGSKFLGWKGDCYLQGNTCLVIFDSEVGTLNVTARFSEESGGVTHPETHCPPKCAIKQLPDPHIREKILKRQPQQ